LKSEFPSAPGDLQKALELATRAYQLRPGEAQVADTLGWVYYKLGDTQRALSLLEEAVSRAPESAIFNYHLGMAQYDKGDKEKARESLRKALESEEDFYGRPEAARVFERLS
jgi:tetratricopeptide (TPR) repeat protein